MEDETSTESAQTTEAGTTSTESSQTIEAETTSTESPQTSEEGITSTEPLQTTEEGTSTEPLQTTEEGPTSTESPQTTEEGTSTESPQTTEVTTTMQEMTVTTLLQILKRVKSKMYCLVTCQQMESCVSVMIDKESMTCYLYNGIYLNATMTLYMSTFENSKMNSKLDCGTELRETTSVLLLLARWSQHSD